MSRELTVLVLLLVIVAAAPTAGWAQEKATAQRPDVQPPGQTMEVAGFHLVLLTADSKAASQVEGVPFIVLKALKDVQQFLPFKGYRLLDSMLIKGASGGSTRINGPDGVIYAASVTSVSGCGKGSSSCSAGFTLTVPGEVATTSGTGGTSSNTVKEPVLKSRVDLVPGEAVVVGASRVTSDSGLVAILTALPKK